MEIQKNGNTLIIHLNDGDSANALSLAKAKSLRKALSQKNISLIVCHSSGRVFCSGGDLINYGKLKTKAQGLKMNREIRLCLSALANHSAWKMAFVHGDCFGGGLEFLGCFDWVVSERSALFGLWQNKMGLSFGWGGYERLSKKAKSTFLKQGLLFAEIKTAETLQAQGVVDVVSSRSEMEKARVYWTERFSKSDSRKEILKRLDRNEVQLFEKLWWSKEHRLALQKFKVISSRK